ncbi:DeoR/GlpR family DNA-binding transcription regulator [Tetragenococcus koreensis]|uniref:DeoR/GlpR family DNA-binding transcription regulator n=1 Tax=Tetragenococcus koreensis TaxID=290335 RepID=UPI001195510A|nr:DeoR/GlpR family DNA-binding transcription regulator [Tetragenococcus koreensis]MCF1585607.1 DeoR/GlpR family DNA-binding transcription regulator [Tetragenococcus koreensis]MCF1615197.1 DeoR/GlpR family DNA-binding transcription regulator [Tetragenococcus koreensis]MCF1620228.1 DeoR/GlpR family DNA-binding transcription regulator [Tetragenococcus koreensis]MCF1624981.1 DeoR/GlpR family DNA-binding transcription regulator [Tetragenococcus koreensis]MCF1629873.1 DeoR/GlpR family DNA-binding t
MEARKEEIIELIKKKKYVSIPFLEEKLHYSQSTIRRDLNYLERLHIIKRVPGGAVLVKEELIENPNEIKYETNKEEKNLIAELAIDFVEDYASIFLDASSTSQVFAEKLKRRKNLKVFTPNLYTAKEIESTRKNQVYLIGGLLNDEHTGGSFCNEMAAQITTDYAFFSCRGFDLNFGASDALENEAGIKKIMKENSKKNFLLLDHTKFNSMYTFQSLTVESIDYMITDRKPNNATYALNKYFEIIYGNDYSR